MKPSFLFISAMFAAGAMVTGCQIFEPTSPVVGLRKPVDPPMPPDLGHGPSHEESEVLYNMYIEEGLRTVCAGPAPFFKFDSTKTRQSEPTMQTLANCLIDGPLKGKSIILIGHTDPRGSAAYNAQLGQDRADRVKKYLMAQGIDGDRIKTATAGEDTASDAPKDWASDRRVEIKLAH